MTPEEYADARRKLNQMKVDHYIRKHPVRAGLIGAGILATPLAVGYVYNRLSGHPAYGHDKTAEQQESTLMNNRYLVKIAQMQKIAAERKEEKPYSIGYGAGGIMAGSMGGGIVGVPAALTAKHMLNNVSDTVSADTVRKYVDNHDLSGVKVYGYSDRLTSALPDHLRPGGEPDFGTFDDMRAGPHHNPMTGRVSAGHAASIHAPESGTVLLHEMSHADFHNRLKKKGLSTPLMAGRMVGPGVGGLVGGAMVGSDEGSKYAAGVNALGYVPTLVDEGQANARAYAHIRKYQPEAIGKGGVRKAVLGSMLSYSAPMVGSSGALYGMHRLRHAGEES